MPGGPTLSFGGLRLESGRVRPCEISVRADESQASSGQSSSLPPAQPANQQSPEILQGRALSEQGMKAFYDARWAEACRCLRQALALPPGDAAIE